jgi:hypothetical protein
MFAAMLGDFSHVASQYLPSLLAHSPAKSTPSEPALPQGPDADSGGKKVEMSS